MFGLLCSDGRRRTEGQLEPGRRVVRLGRRLTADQAEAPPPRAEIASGMNRLLAPLQAARSWRPVIPVSGAHARGERFSHCSPFRAGALEKRLIRAGRADGLNRCCMSIVVRLLEGKWPLRRRRSCRESRFTRAMKRAHPIHGIDDAWRQCWLRGQGFVQVMVDRMRLLQAGRSIRRRDGCLRLARLSRRAWVSIGAKDEVANIPHGFPAG